MITSWSAIAYAEECLSTGLTEHVLQREDVEALLDHISNLEYEVFKLKGTFAVLDED